jgi:ferredoxin
VSHFAEHRILIARRATQLSILGLFWFGANQHLGVLTGNLSASHVFRTIPLADPFAVLQILATGHLVADSVLLGAAIVLACYALAGHRSPLRVGFDAERCDRCGDCVVVCPEKQVIDFKAMAASGFIDSGECTHCNRCLEACPRDAYQLTLRFRRGAAKHPEEGEHHATQSAA